MSIAACANVRHLHVPSFTLVSASVGYLFMELAQHRQTRGKRPYRDRVKLSFPLLCSRLTTPCAERTGWSRKLASNFGEAPAVDSEDPSELKTTEC